MQKESAIYEIMHADRRVARIDTSGQCKIYFSSFLPLYQWKHLRFIP